jgi:hypothetical protein
MVGPSDHCGSGSGTGIFHHATPALWFDRERRWPVNIRHKDGSIGLNSYRFCSEFDDYNSCPGCALFDALREVGDLRRSLNRLKLTVAIPPAIDTQLQFLTVEIQSLGNLAPIKNGGKPPGTAGSQGVIS